MTTSACSVALQAEAGFRTDQLRSLRAGRIVESLPMAGVSLLFMLPDEPDGLFGVAVLPVPMVLPLVEPAGSMPLCEPVLPGVRTAPDPAGGTVLLVEPELLVPVCPGVIEPGVVVLGPVEPAEPPVPDDWAWARPSAISAEAATATGQSLEGFFIDISLDGR